jgi:peptide/nickel transport system permease protein
VGKYILRRVVSLVPVLLLISIITFVLIYLVPGDPASVMLGVDATPQEVEQLREEMGLNKPIHVRFLIWGANVLRGDLGESFYLGGRKVAGVLFERLPATIELALAALVFAVLIGVPMGIIAAIRHNTLADQVVMSVTLIGISIPSFWLGLILILVLSVGLRLLPSGGYAPISEDFFRWLRYILLPAFSLGFMQSALIARMTRSSMLDVLKQDYIRTARAKGLAAPTVITRHALKNAMIPILTTVGITFGVLLGGAIIVETVFTYPGVGRLVVMAVQRRDYPLMQGALLLIGCGYAVVNLVVDVMYALIDPRIKY